MSALFSPELHTPEEHHNKVEHAKGQSNGLSGDLYQEFRNAETDITWESEQLAKSYGIYLEFNRAKTGREKDWMYMIRLGVPGGGPISAEQWLLLDELAETYGRNPEGYASLRLTTREAVQFHWVSKEGVLDIVRRAAESGLLSLNGCGDNVRNVMACPLADFSDVFDGASLAREIARFFQLPGEAYVKIFAIDPGAIEQEYERFQYGPQLLNRKFKIAVSGLHRDLESGEVVADNCVELRTHDMGIQPLYENGGVQRYQIFVGGGQGEKNGKVTGAMLAQSLGVVDGDRLRAVLEAVVAVHQEWGDRNNRHWARLKYVIRANGIEWYRQKVADRVGFELDAPVEVDIGPRHLHHGWQTLPNQRLAFGMFLENGRIVDNSRNGALLTTIRELVRDFQPRLYLTPNQDLIFTDIEDEQRDAFEAHLRTSGYGARNGKPFSALRMRSGACVGRDTCRLAYTDSEKFEPFLIDALEERGWGELRESIGVTGCERQCFRPATKTIGLVGSGGDRYQVKLMGDESGRFQGVPVIDGDQVYLRMVPRDRVVPLLDVLFSYHRDTAGEGESVGAFFRRIGMAAIIDVLKQHPETAGLMQKPQKFKGLSVLSGASPVPS